MAGRDCYIREDGGLVHNILKYNTIIYYISLDIEFFLVQIYPYVISKIPSLNKTLDFRNQLFVLEEI